MKRKFLVVLMAIAATLCMAFGLSACSEKNPDATGNNPPVVNPSGGEQGNQGNQGGGTQKPDDGEQGGTPKPDEGEQGGTPKPDEGEQKPETYSKGLRYTEIYGEDGTTVIGYSVTGIGDCSDKKIFIPETYEEKPVTSIGDEAFYNCYRLTSVIIPSSVTSIGNGAFWVCSGLTSVTIGSGVTSIGESAFMSCKKIISVTIPDGVTSIGSNAFNGCSGLTSIIIPDNVTSIGSAAFSRCSGLTEIKVNPNNQTYHAKNNCLIETNSKTLIAGCKTSKIPDDGSVTKIGNAAFSGCIGLTSIIIPNSVTSIGEGAFYGCNELSEITLPFVGNRTKQTHFGYIFGASEYNYNSKYVPASLKKVTITHGTLIGAEAFRDCSGLTSITIPNSVTSIGENAFGGCSGLTEIKIDSNNQTYHAKNNCLIETESKTLIVGCKTSKIPDDGSVTSIGENAFYGCSGLTSIDVPDSVTSIGGSAFYDCCGLTSITIGSGVTLIGKWTFVGCSGLTSITIPDSVTEIGERAFEQCSKLASVTIGSGVTLIKELAFFSCNSLKEVKFKNLNGWKVSTHYYGYITVSGLEDPAQAAKMLRDTYCDSIWKRG